eukprot:763744-Hanusia_phi.AAC.3
MCGRTATITLVVDLGHDNPPATQEELVEGADPTQHDVDGELLRGAARRVVRDAPRPRVDLALVHHQAQRLEVVGDELDAHGVDLGVHGSLLHRHQLPEALLRQAQHHVRGAVEAGELADPQQQVAQERLDVAESERRAQASVMRDLYRGELVDFAGVRLQPVLVRAELGQVLQVLEPLLLLCDPFLADDVQAPCVGKHEDAGQIPAVGHGPDAVQLDPEGECRRSSGCLGDFAV